MKFSIVIPVRNESAILRDTLAWLRKTGGPTTEIIVVDAGSTDQTSNVARPLADHVLAARKPGRAFQMDLGAKSATGDIIVFLHADTVLPENWREALEAAWSASPRPAATAFRLGFDQRSFSYRLVCRLAHFRTKRLTGVPHGDQAIAVSRDLYRRVGGFPDVPLLEEYYLIRGLRREGAVRLLRETVTTSARRYRRNGVFFNAFRNVFIIALFYCGISPRRLVRLYS